MFKQGCTCFVQIVCLHVLMCYGDPPVVSPTTVAPQIATTQMPGRRSPERSDLAHRRQYMLWMIRHNFMTEMGWNTLPTIDSRSMTGTTIDLPSVIRYLTLESQSCYAASCTLNEHIRASMWNNPANGTMNIFFNIITHPAGDVTAKNATLSLFVGAREDCGCAHAEETDVRLLMEVNQYMQALRPRRDRRNRIRAPRKRNLDMAILNWNEQRWIHFDVTSAVDDWMSRNRRFGLEVKVLRIASNGASRSITDFNPQDVFGAVDCSLPIDIPCLQSNSQMRFNNPAPVLYVWTETRPMMNAFRMRAFRMKRSAQQSNGIPRQTSRDDEMGSNPLSTIAGRSIITGTTVPSVIRNQPTSESQSCYAASCTLPENTDASMWNNPATGTMHIYFKRINHGDLTAKNATLSLYVKAREGCGCAHAKEDDIRLMVEVNQYMQAILRPCRDCHNSIRAPRKRYLDMAILNWNEKRLINFDVTMAVDDWMATDSQFGLEVKVSRIGSNGASRSITDFNPQDVFGAVDCSLPIEVSCPEPNSRLRLNNGTPVLDVWTDTTPMMSSSFKTNTSAKKSNRIPPRRKRLATLLAEIDDKS